MSEENKTFENFFQEMNGEEKKEGQAELTDALPKSADVLPKVDPNIPPPSPSDIKVLKSNEDAFESLVVRCNEVMTTLPFQGQKDYQHVKEEVTKGRIQFEESPSPLELSRQIGIIQQLKDNLIDIFAESHRNHIVRKRIYELLFDAYMAISQQKSSDKRKGEATLKLSEFSLSSAEAEAFYTYCKQIIDNLESQHKTVSRRIACMQAQLTLGELATGGQEITPLETLKRETLKDLKSQVNSEPGSVDWDENDKDK